MVVMADATEILSQIESGDPTAAEQLLPLVYNELRRLAAAKLAHEKPGQTLQATELVHEAYLRLVDTERAQRWDSRGHFFAAAAEAMRRILVDRARRSRRPKHGGNRQRIDPDEVCAVGDAPSIRLLVLDEALAKLAAENAAWAELVKLRYFAGLTLNEAAAVLGVSRATAARHWTYGKAWLYCAGGATSLYMRAARASLGAAREYVASLTESPPPRKDAPSPASDRVRDHDGLHGDPDDDDGIPVM
jgi:RNA polymerase sigma factor (TIGR02999 family)